MDPNFNIGQIPTTQFNIPQPKQGGGMFGGGGKKALSVIAEAMAAYAAGMGNPGGMAVLQGMNHRRQSAADAETQEQQYQRQRSDGMADWIAKQEWELANPSPTQGSEYERALAAQGIVPGTPQYAERMAKIAAIKENPMVMTAYGPMPYSAVAGGGQQQNLPPTLSDDDFAPQGGPRPLGAGGFPGSF
jgi:hypothetical protein